MTYARAGVNSRHVQEAHEVLARRLGSTFETRRGKVGWPLVPIGHYAGLVDLGDGRVLSLHTDSVGTKVLVARVMGKFDTIGIDCVAMCANDLICTGAEPISFLDYIAMSKPDRAVVEEVAVGLVKGAKEAEMAIVGGETAVVPELLSAEGGFDLVGFAIGFCRKKDLILGDKVREGDCLVGVASSGIHSNGLSLARRVLLKKYNVRDRPKGLDRSLGEELLEPTRIYVKPVKELLKSGIQVHGIAHITGGGAFVKMERILGRFGAELNGLPEPPGIFQLIKKVGRVSEGEMYRTFNMGIGLVVACPNAEADRIVQVFKSHRQAAMIVGSVEKMAGVWVNGLRLN